MGWVKEMEREGAAGWGGRDGGRDKKRRSAGRDRVREKEKTRKLKRNSD